MRFSDPSRPRRESRRRGDRSHSQFSEARGTAVVIAVDLDDAIGNVVAMVQGEIKRQGVTLRIASPHGLPPAVVDRIKLQDVNAICAVLPYSLADLGQVIRRRTSEAPLLRFSSERFSASTCRFADFSRLSVS
jgi:hypothetical protein